MLVREMLPATRQRLASVGSTATLAEVARLLTVKHTNLVLVCDSAKRMVGVVADSDIVRWVATCPEDEKLCAIPATQVMTRDVVSCRPEDQLYDVWSVMKDRSLRHVPVIGEDSRPVGVLYARDALKSLLREVQHEEDLLRDYIMGVGFH